MQKKIVLQYYILSGLLSFCGLSMVSAIYTSFLLKHGLSLSEVNFVNAAFYISLFVCEIPTGAFADIFGRKTSFVMACLLLGFAKLIYSWSYGFWGFVGAEITAALAITFYNGAFLAWFVDSMKHSGYAGDFKKFFGKNTLISQVSAAFGALLGGYLFTLDITLPWIAGSVLMFVLTLVAIFIMKEEYFKHSKFSFKDGSRRMIDVARQSIRYGVNHKAVRFVLVIMFVQIMACQALNMYWQPFFGSRGLSESRYGALFATMIGALALGAYAATKLKRTGEEKKMIVMSQVGTGIFIILTAFMPSLTPALILFVIHEVPRGLFIPLKESYLQTRIPSEERATISSFCSIAPHIGGVFGLVVSGLVAEHISINASWVLAGLIIIVGSLLVARNGDED